MFYARRHQTSVNGSPFGQKWRGFQPDLTVTRMRDCKGSVEWISDKQKNEAGSPGQNGFYHAIVAGKLFKIVWTLWIDNKWGFVSAAIQWRSVVELPLGVPMACLGMVKLEQETRLCTDEPQGWHVRSRGTKRLQWVIFLLGLSRSANNGSTSHKLDHLKIDALFGRQWTCLSSAKCITTIHLVLGRPNSTGKIWIAEWFTGNWDFI